MVGGRSSCGRRATGVGTGTAVIVTATPTVSTHCPSAVPQKTATSHGIPRRAPPPWLPPTAVALGARDRS